MKNRIYDAFNEIKAKDKLKQDTYAFLQEKINRKKQVAFKKFSLALASVILIFFAGLLSYNLYFTQIAFVDIDVNPSIELSLNKFNCVIDVYAYNSDGQEVLNNINIKNKSYKDALQILINKMVEMGYIKDSGLFTATLQMNENKNEKELLDSLKAYIDSALETQNKNVEQDIFEIDSNIKTYSYEQNLTPAKYLAILELQEFDPIASFDSCRDHTISEIREQTHNHMNGNHESNGNNNHESCSDLQDHGSSGSSHEIKDSNGNHGGTANNNENSQNTNNLEHEHDNKH